MFYRKIDFNDDLSMRLVLRAEKLSITFFSIKNWKCTIVRHDSSHESEFFCRLYDGHYKMLLCDCKLLESSRVAL